MSDNAIQQHPNVGRPRVSITYDRQIDDTIEKRKLPFVVGVLADLSGHPPRPLPGLIDRRFVEINQDNFHSVLAAIHPAVLFSVPNRLIDEQDSMLRIDLFFESIDDFGPEGVARQIAPLRGLLEIRQRLEKLRDLPPDASLPDDAEMIVRARITALDALLSAQLNEILHHPDFQRLEAAWRGLHYLVFHTPVSPELKVRVLNVSKQDLRRDCVKASEFKQTVLFQKLEEEYGTPSGQPFTVLIGDYEFGPRPEDLEILETVSAIAAAAQAPFIAAVSPSMFGKQSFTELGYRRDLAKIVDDPVYARWSSLRKNEDARYLGLVLPRMLLRLPFGRDAQPVESFDYEEGVDGTDHGKYLWGNAAYALGTCLTKAFAKYGWSAAIRSVEGGGLVEGLPIHTFPTGDGEVAIQCPTEVAVLDPLDSELDHLGLISILYYKGTDMAVFFSASSCFRPPVYLEPEATACARMSAQLPYIMAAARFTHYLRCISADRFMSFHSRGANEQFLNRWISQYVRAEELADMKHRAQFPLSSAHIELYEVPGSDRYSATLRISPRFQLEPLPLPLRVIFTVPK